MALLIGDLLADAAALRPGGVAATLGERDVTFGRLDRDANRTAHALAGLGVRTGDVVAWWAGPALRTLDGFAAAARLGAPFASLNPGFSPEEVRAALEYLRPRLLVADADRAEVAEQLCADTDVQLAVSAGDDAGGDFAGGAVAGGAVPGEHLDELTESAGAASPVRPLDDGDPHIVYLTSGTTGRPKGVVVSHRASWMRAFPGNSTFATGLRGDGGILASFGLFHYGGWHFVLEAWHHRCPIHLVPRFDGPTLVATVARRRPTALYCIPALWARILEADAPADALASVRHADTGTSATPIELLLRLRERMPDATTSVLYGSSEGGHHTTLASHDIAKKPGSVGRVAPPGLLRIGDDGEILYRSPTVMSGYWDRPAETAAALAGGWYHTGDLGTLDDEGYLTITGRLREVIRTAGETVAPAEVEAAVALIPGVADAAVIGLPDPRWGEVVCAAVVLAPGAPAIDVEAVRVHLGGGANRLAAHKHPRRLVVVDRIPRTAATRQVQRALLREQLAVAAESGEPPE